MEQLLAQMPEDLDLRLTLADLKHAAKDDAGALAALREYALKAGAAKEGTALRVAGLMDRYGLTGEAVQTLRDFLTKTENAEGRLMLASLLHKSGDKEGALTEWRKVAAAGVPAVVQQTARAMQAHGETSAAWELMTAAAPQAEKDTIFLTQLCTLADDPPRAAAALPFARQLVELARSGPDLNGALDAALRVARLSGKAEEYAAELAKSAASAQALCLLATLREAARDTIGANEALEKAQAVAPDLALAQLVRLWTMRGDFGQAAAVAERLFNSPGGRQGHVAEMLASLHQRAGNPEAALHWTQEWRKLVPGAAAPVLSEARLLEYLDREGDALTTLRSAAGRFEGNDEIRSRLAALSLDTGRTAEALRYYSGLYEEAADLSARMRWLTEWGEAAQQAGQLDNLIAQFEDRRRENRGSVAPVMALAELHRIADNYEARRKALTEAARLKPDDPEILLEIARLEAREGDDEAAVRTLRPMLAKDASGRVASLMADLLINGGQLDEGLKLLTDSTGASPTAVETAALSLARREEEKTALEFLQPHLAKMTADWRVQFLGALLEWRTGNNEAAATRLATLTGVTAPLARSGPGNAQPPVTAPGYEDLVLRIMPPDARRFFQLLQAAAEVNPNNNNPWSYSRQSIYTQLPGNVEEMQFRSAALLLDIAKTAVPEKKEVWLTELEQHGFSFARLFMELPRMRRLEPADRYFDFSALLRAHPDSRPLLAFAALAKAYPDYEIPPDAGLAEKAWAAFGKESPQTGVFLALPAAGQGKTRAAWEEEVLAAAEKLPSASPLLVLAVVKSGRIGEGLDEGNEETFATKAPPEDWRKRMVALLERWRAQTDAAGGGARGYAENMRAWSFLSLAKEYTWSKAAHPLAALMESEWQWQAGRPQTPLRSNSNEGLAQPLGFPPWFLPGLPETLREFMQRYITPEVAGQTAPLMKEPMLRVLLASKARGEAADRAVKEVQSGGAASAMPFILGASWEEKRGDFAAAGERAVKALYLPVSQDTRRRLDGALAYWAAKKGRPGDALFAAGREAALRLRRDALTDERRAELATLMDRLGLTEEADRLMRQGKAADAAGGMAPGERLQKLLEEGKNKEALPALLAELRGWARDRLNHGNMPSIDPLITWRGRVQVNGLLPDVMQALLPAQATAQQMAEYAAACELTGEPARAEEYYGRAVAGGVRKQAPQLLLYLKLRHDKKRGLELLKEFPDVWTAENVRRWVPVLTQSDDRRNSLEELVTYVEFMMQAIALLPEKHAATFPADMVMDIAENEAWSGNFFQTTYVYQEKKTAFRGDPPPEERQRVEALLTARYEACEALARRFLTIPGCGLDAWTHLERLRESRKKESAEVLSDGMAMLARELRLPAAKRGGNNDDSRMQAVTLELMQQASAAGRTEEFAKVVAPAVRETRSPLTAAAFLRAWPLYEAGPDKFSEAARAMVKERGRAAWSDVISAAVRRKTGMDLTPDLKEVWKHPDEKDDGPDGYFSDWCACLEKALGRAAAEQFFHEVINGLLGPAEGRAALFKEKGSLRLKAVKRLVADLTDETGWAGFALRWVRDEWLSFAPKDEPQSNIGEEFSEYALSTPLYGMIRDNDFTGVRAYLDSLPVTEDLPGFFVLRTDMMTNLSRAVMELPEDERVKAGMGRDEKDPTFGRRVLRGLTNGWITGVCRELAGWEPKIEALPEAHRTRVLETLRDFAGTLQGDVSAEARAFYKWLTKEKEAKAKEEMDQSITKFLKQVEEGDFENEEAVASSLRSLTGMMAAEENPRGREVIAAARRAAEACGPREHRSQLLETLLEPFNENRGWIRPRSNLAWRTGLVAAALSAGEPPALTYDNEIYYIGYGLRLDEAAEGGDLLENLLNQQGPYLQPGEPRLLMLWIMVYYSSRGAGERLSEGLRRMESLRGKTPYEELRLETEMALRWMMMEGGPKGVTDEAALPEAQRHYLAVLLRDTKLSAPLRLALGTALLGLRGDGVEPPLVLEVARQLQQAFAEGRVPTASQEAGVFTALDKLAPAHRDAALEKSLLSLTTLPRLRGSSFDNSVVSGLLALLNMSLRLGDTGTVDRLLEMEGQFPGVGALTVLARHGQKKRIADLLKERPEVLQRVSDIDGREGQWDEALAAALPEAVSEIADPLLRFEALAKFTVRMDPDPLPAGLKPHAQRCAETAALMAGVPWRSPRVKDRVVDLTVWWNETPPPATLPFMEDAVKRVPIEAVPHIGGGTEWVGFHAALIVRALAAGDGKPLLDALETLEGVTMSRSEYVINVRDALLSTVDRWLVSQWGDLTPETRSAVCRTWRDLLLKFEQHSQWGQQWTDQAYFAVLLHSLAGRMEDLRVWHASLTATLKASMRLWLEDKTPGDAFSDLALFDSIPGSAEEKAVRLRTVFLDLALSPLGGGIGNWADAEFLNLKGGTPEEFLKLEGPFTTARPEDGWLAVSFARVHAKTGAWDKVLARTEAALTKVKPEQDSAYAPLLELRTRALEQSGRGGETLEAIKALPGLPRAENSNGGVESASQAAQARLMKRVAEAKAP